MEVHRLTPATPAPARRWLRAGTATLLAAAGIATGLVVGSTPASAATPIPITALASATAELQAGNAHAGSRPQLAADGRFVAFTSSATNLTSGTTTAVERVYLRDLWTDQVTLISTDTSGAATPSPAYLGAITPSGSHIAFSTAAKLVPTDTNGTSDVYVYDRNEDSLDLVSRGWNGAQANGKSGILFSTDSTIALSDDGRYVAFESEATNLLASTDSNGVIDVYRFDRTNRSMTIVSVDGAVASNGNSISPDISGNGRYVVFVTASTSFGGTDTNVGFDVWLRDFNSISSSKVSVGTDSDPNGASYSPKVSDDGTKVVFESVATDLVAADTNGSRDVFLRNRSASTTTRVSVANAGGAQLATGAFGSDMSDDGAQVAFSSTSKATTSDTNAVADIFVREGSVTRLESVDTGGAISSQNAFSPSIADDAVAWSTTQAFASVDTNNKTDVYVRHQPFFGPFDSLDLFTARQLSRIRGGTITLEQLIPARAALEDGASPFTFVLREIDAPAFSGKRAPLIRLYWAYFKRRPDLGGLTYWLNRYNSGKRLVDISQEFAKSSEFKTKYGNTTPEQFVTLVYQNVLERNPDANGLGYWANKIRNGTPRGQVMTNFSESSEGQRVIGPRSDSILVALGMYGKVPSQTLFDAMVADRQAGFPREIIVAYILGAPEYAATL